jgi:hypothetical protein
VQILFPQSKLPAQFDEQLILRPESSATYLSDYSCGQNFPQV